LSGLLHSSRATDRAHLIVRVAMGGAWVIAALHVVLGAVFPAEHLNEYDYRLGSAGFASKNGFWIFASVWLAIAIVFAIGWGTLVRQHLDRGEHARAWCLMVTSPLLVIATATPVRLSIMFGSIALMTLLFGQFRYLVAAGERSAFLSRFLSPQVADQVRVDGLTTVMQPGEVVLTVVACDLRGFTSYAEGVPSQAVIDLLSEYYQAVGTAVAEVDGTIKDYAGDGILILIGAPLPHPGHATAGLQLARRIHEVTTPVLHRWATDPHPLDIGVGVATGRVTVGAIGSDARMEYTAVGTPVNLAARLCSSATAGETLIDEHTAAEATDACTPRGTMTLKGLAAPVPVFAFKAAESALP
ncbi:MAG: adenylate/guanylate cyclase domain-containing protein, partial [Aeromicrobium sp.]